MNNILTTTTDSLHAMQLTAIKILKLSLMMTIASAQQEPAAQLDTEIALVIMMMDAFIYLKGKTA